MFSLDTEEASGYTDSIVTYMENTVTISACSACGRNRHIISNGMCNVCFRESGQPAIPVATTTPCTIGGCGKAAVAMGLCQKHYARSHRHGHVEDTRPADWGKREKHPLYIQWCRMNQTHKGSVCSEWLDFWQFVSDVGERPSEHHMLVRKNVGKPYAADNFWWRERLPAGAGKKASNEAKAAYMREYRAKNSEYFKSRDMEKRFGISLDEYGERLSAQNGVCFVCRQPEQNIDKRSGKSYALAVDHSHITGEVRDLLCSGCNNALGCVSDDVGRLVSLIVYIAKHSKDSVSAITGAISQLQAALPAANTA